MPNPSARTKSIGSKVTEDEYASLEKLAQDRSLSVSEWCREVMLAQLNPAPPSTIQEVLLAEILAVRMILLNSVFALANGTRLGTEEMKELIHKADAEKLLSATQRLQQLVSRRDDQSTG